MICSPAASLRLRGFRRSKCHPCVTEMSALGEGSFVHAPIFFWTSLDSFPWTRGCHVDTFSHARYLPSLLLSRPGLNHQPRLFILDGRFSASAAPLHEHGRYSHEQRHSHQAHGELCP